MTRPTKSKMEAIKPEQQDFDAVEKEYGPLPPNASQAALAERYPLAQAAKVIRQLEQVAFSGKTKNQRAGRSAVKLLTRDEAQRIAANIAELPEPVTLLEKPGKWGDHPIALPACAMPKPNHSSAVFDHPKNLGFDAHVFNNDDVVRLLKAAVKREGGQTAFAKRHAIDRPFVNMVLNGKRPVGDSIVRALGLRKVYIGQ